MNIQNVITNLKNKTNKMTIQVKKHSPEILIAAGVVGAVASTVLACRATLKVNDILEETKDTLDKIKMCSESEEYKESGYTVEDAKKDKAIVYVQTGVKIAKLYAPAAALGVLSITAIVASHNILSKRNAALATAYVTINQSFKKYRENVVERFGERVDLELKNGIKVKKIEETIVDPETGKEKRVKSNIEVANPSDYAVFFDEKCHGWDKNMDYNMMFLKAQQQYANDKLRADGFLFLNDVYEMLGMNRTKMGQVVGWVYKPENPVGDNFVDFGIFETHKGIEDGMYEKTILLNFNVDGPILDLI